MAGLTLGTQETGITNYQQTFTSFSGADIIATFNERVIGELQAITFSITREKAPVYTMGSADPRSFSRGKRGIAGSLVFTVFDRDSLIDEMKKTPSEVKGNRQVTPASGEGILSGTVLATDIAKQPGKVLLPTADPLLPVARQNEFLTQQILGGGFIKEPKPFEYSDQIPPFHITVTMANEYGQAAMLRILYAEILNEGMGFSIDDIVTEKACTFVARRVEYLRSLGSVQLDTA